MDYSTLINQILAAERTADSIASEALERQANLDSELAAERAEIMERHMDRAKARLEQLRKEEQARKESALAAQDARLSETSAKMEQAYTRYGDNWVDTLFRQVVGDQ